MSQTQIVKERRNPGCSITKCDFNWRVQTSKQMKHFLVDLHQSDQLSLDTRKTEALIVWPIVGLEVDH